MLRLAVFDDQEEHLNYIVEVLSNALDNTNLTFEIKTMIQCDSLYALLDLETIPFDFLFIDICTQEGTTLDFTRTMYQKYPDIQIVYITNYDNYYKDIFYSSVFYYVEKKDLSLKIDQIIEKILDYYASKKFMIHTKNKDIYFQQSQIMYLERKLRMTYIEDCYGEIYTCNEKLSDLALRLNHRFIRVHESYIVNSDYIAVMKRTFIELINGKEIPVSRKYHNLLKERLFL